jgi:hypothetical protein
MPVKESWPGRKGRTAVIEGTGQNGLPAIRTGKFGADAAG